MVIARPKQPAKIDSSFFDGASGGQLLDTRIARYTHCSTPFHVTPRLTRIRIHHEIRNRHTRRYRAAGHRHLFNPEHGGDRCVISILVGEHFQGRGDRRRVPFGYGLRVGAG